VYELDIDFRQEVSGKCRKTNLAAIAPFFMVQLGTKLESHAKHLKTWMTHSSKSDNSQRIEKA
jgi:hypothetical protein